MDDDPIRLVDLPPEIILETAIYLSLNDLNSLVRTAKQFNTILSSQLYTVGAKHRGPKRTALISAIEHCTASAVEKLLEKGADPSVYGGHYNAFTTAVERYKPRVLKMLIARSASASVPRTGFNYLLQIAVDRRRTALLRILLDAAPGHDPDDEDDGPVIAAVDYAICKSRLPAARLLLKAAKKTTPSPGDKIPATTISNTIYRGDCPSIQLMIEFGWNPQAPIGTTIPLHIAAGAGSMDLAKLLLSFGLDVNGRDRQGATPLHMATIREHAGVVDLLLSTGADVNASNTIGETPLHRSMYHDSPRILDRLLSAGAKANVVDERGVAPLHTAITFGKPVEMVERLIEAAADVNAPDPHSQTPFFLAAKAGSPQVLRALVAAGADADGGTGAAPLRPFHAAAAGNHVQVIEPLLEVGLDINGEDYIGRTPLFVATISDSLDFMRELIRRGANPDCAVRGQTPIYGAVSKTNVEALRILLEAGANVKVLGPEGDPILHEAASEGASHELIQILIDHGADPCAVASDKGTALHYAVMNNKDKTIGALISAGTPIEARDSDGDTALLIAARRSCEGTRELLEAGADPNVRALDRSTPLHHCSSYTDTEIYTMLMAAGADITAKDETGQTPLHCAAAVGNVIIFERLLREYTARGLDYTESDRVDRTVLELAASAGAVGSIDKLLRQGVPVDSGLDTTHGKHRGIPALHYAILNNMPRAVACLARGGAEYFNLDIYGRSAIDWASIDHSGKIRDELARNDQHGRGVASAPRTSTDQQSKVLKSSVVGIAARILEGHTIDVYKLAKCLQYLDDTTAAGAVYAEVDSYCDICKNPIPKTDMRFICTECPDIDLCAPCMTTYDEDDIRIQICQRHRFWGIVVLENRLPQQMLEGEELMQARAEWLEDLIKRYSE